MMYPTDEERVPMQQHKQQPSLLHRYVKRKDFLRSNLPEPPIRSHVDSSMLEGAKAKYSHYQKQEKQHIRHRSLPSPHSMLELVRLESMIHRSRQRSNRLIYLILLAIGLVGLGCCLSSSIDVQPTLPNKTIRRNTLVAFIDEQDVDRPRGQPQAGLRGSIVSHARKKSTGRHVKHDDPPKSRKAGEPHGIQKRSIHKDQKQTNENNHRHEKQDEPIRGTENMKTPTKNKNTRKTNKTPYQNVMKVIKPTGDVQLLFAPFAFDKEDHNLYSKWNEVHKSEAPHRAPRIVFLDKTRPMTNPPKERKVGLYQANVTDNTQLYGILDSQDDKEMSSMEMKEPYVQGECVPMQEWQITFHPSCNNMHELGLSERVSNEKQHESGSIVGTKGFWRHAWRVDFVVARTKIYNRESVVLKTLKLVHNFEDAHFEHDRIDAVAMEKLTSSPHIVNAFGFCGHSVLTDFADGQRLGTLADKAQKIPLARLKMARDIASGLADVHGIDGDGNATFVHLDINPSNILSVGGTLKLNDFNIGHFMRWNTTSNTKCTFDNSQYPNPQWRSPEEAKGGMLTEKVDVFSMGHLFFRLICGHEPWNKLEPGGKPSKETIHQKVVKGVLPFVPKKVAHTKDKEVAAIREAMFKCYTYDPKNRPSARQIANYLNGVIEKLE